MTQIAITHMGLCTPLGQEPQQILARLLQGDDSAMCWREDLLFDGPALVGQVDCPLPQIPAALAQYDCRNNQMLLSAAGQLAQAVLDAKSRYGSERIGVVIGTSTSGIASGEAALKYRQQHGVFPGAYHYHQQELGGASEFLSRHFGLTGPSYTLSTACSSSAKVFAAARRLLNADLCDLVIVGGVDSLCQLTLNGFQALESVSSGHCQPFSANRDGINIGEGAALFTLERGSGSLLLAGVGESADAYHISAPHPEGLGAIAAMTAALQDAGLTPADISYVNLHGTATPKNDAMESRALLAVFGDTLPPCSSTKPLTGHALGAAGAIEAAFCCLLLSAHNSQNGLPPQLWDGQQDSRDPALPLVQPGQHGPLEYVMSNSFAFGGSNASLIFCRGVNHA
ncbi:beta-ketoacyl-[acyl-carrier-protein] synthase family protein [Shewanella salipaludis]|uniref:Beta-ketoacyl-[acyl-carrier-protein] synthase family protein n=1 Tax=Shewanella salipaludis TaxID=2723052 RepID=A0A972G2I2_9GAMM|nr:beta-ketoacyl-[acyl-carrier-protein] synthase family protein [Shewanella salipaludis]NMH66301.1 beta-ketoacyl-[acyl-carrier-protein] synthase family protein [Shewanella salipaludis]